MFEGKDTVKAKEFTNINNELAQTKQSKKEALTARSKSRKAINQITINDSNDDWASL